MYNPTKPGGGNKPEPYIPAGNGPKSGEYTDKYTCNQAYEKKHVRDSNCNISNIKGLYNPMNSRLVGKVTFVISVVWGHKIPTIFRPNSVIKKTVNGKIVEERYFNSKGETYLEIHYTNHGNPKAHPKVPHIHRSTITNGIFNHAPWEEFK